MGGGVLGYANRIISVCKTLKALPPNDSAFFVYRRRLFSELQRLVLTIGLGEREDAFKESEHPRAENGQFEAKGSKQPVKSVRKGNMKPEVPVTFKNHGSVTRGKAGRPITRFNHDEEKMSVEKGFPLYDDEMDRYDLSVGDIEHLTVFAGKGTEKKIDMAVSIARQYGGKPEEWKHVKGMGTVKDKKGNEREADIHWFENENVGQAGWKIKQFRSEMGESQIYWENK